MREYVENDLYDLRVSDNATQESLAQALGVSRQTIIAIEKGNYTPSILLALKISAHFKVPVERVFRIIRKK